MSTKTVAVLGASYGGARAAQVLAQGLPAGWRVVLIDRNSHMNHLYVLPRYAILPAHAHKAFIPYTRLFASALQAASQAESESGTASASEVSPHVVLHAEVTSLSTHSLTLSRAFPEHGIAGSPPTLAFDYVVYALGSHLPGPINLWGPIGDEHEVKEPIQCGTKAGGIGWLTRFHDQVERASSVLVVGGGALGIQYATDIAEAFPTKHVTLLHSRTRLLPKFDEQMHSEILSSLSTLNIDTVLGERLDLESARTPKVISVNGQIERVVRTESGREIHASMVLLCTGQTPNTALLKDLLPDAIIPEGPSKGMVRVKRTMQVAEDEEDDTHLHVPHPHIFAIGDAADAFGAINAGHTAYHQGEAAAKNIVRLIQRSEGKALVRNADAGHNLGEELVRYAPGAPAIKVSLGLSRSVYQIGDAVGTKGDAPHDLDAHLMWRFYGVDDEDLDMRA
ncbi:iron uptake cluster protein [Obba rivulosa]|uniref:Iron uptake cluster protein n=1 Tax=Obba rivulosa TaxID=1052685 RepID=A0A8E2DKJ7_9APHY|nr:iron uptake cluster protein [Obba rivulosa]